MIRLALIFNCTHVLNDSILIIILLGVSQYTILFTEHSAVYNNNTLNR